MDMLSLHCSPSPFLIKQWFMKIKRTLFPSRPCMLIKDKKVALGKKKDLRNTLSILCVAGTSDVDLQKTRKILIIVREALQSKFKPTKKMQVHCQTPGKDTLKKRKNKGKKRAEEASPLRNHHAQNLMWLSVERRLLPRINMLVGPTQWKERMCSCKLSWLSHAYHSICAACTACVCAHARAHARSQQLLPLALFAIE